MLLQKYMTQTVFKLYRSALNTEMKINAIEGSI